MWFKNLSLYRVTGWNVAPGQLEGALAGQAFRNCGNMEMESRGWLAPRGSGDALVHCLGRQMLISLCVEQRLLPASVINQYAKARADEIEAAQGSRPGRKQLREIRERLAEELMPRAFTRRRSTFVWIDPVNGWLVIDAANTSKAEEVLDVLRKSLEAFPLALVKTQLSPTSAMTGWLAANEAPAGFSIDRDCELLAPGEEKATVRYVRHPLESQEIKNHIEEGKEVTKLALTWDDRISFVLHENLQTKRLAFLDILKEQSEQNAEAADEQFDADFAIMTGELARFLPELIAALGGEFAEA